jgi:glycosyltransferase involved in cell wall biosynthesis
MRVVEFSVILPVRNGWPYVKDCVESVLSQSHRNLELTILDNQSKDETVPWVESLRDPRVRLFKSDRSLSISESWARARHVDKREFVTLIGHDDLFDPTFLEVVAALIGKHPKAALYQTGARFINSRGARMRACQPVAEHETAADYLTARFLSKRDVFGTGFVMRSADYDRVGGIPPFEKLLFADDALWLSLMEGSYKANDPRELFSVRIHPKSESASLPSAWLSLLLGLNQFTEFLSGYTQRNADVRSVVENLAPSFLLNYHRNLYIFALVHACQQNTKIDPATVARIESSLATHAPGVAPQLHSSAKVRAIEALNASPLRAGVPHLWNAYYRLKTRAA